MNDRYTTHDVISTVHDGVLEAISYSPDSVLTLDDGFDGVALSDDAGDAVHEIADGSIPVYYSQLAECLADDPDLAEVDDPGLLGESPTVWQIISIALYEKASGAGYEIADTVAEYLSEFVPAYVRALAWSERPDLDSSTSDATDLDREAWGESDDDAIANIDSAAGAEIIADCAAFVADNWHALHFAETSIGFNADDAGHDYALTRNGHGTGYWDREDLSTLLVRGVRHFERYADDPTRSVAGILSDASEAAGPRGLHSGDDGALYS